jgi:hypothetical protein
MDLIRAALIIASLGILSPAACAQTTAGGGSALARLQFTKDYFPGWRDAQGQFMGGTEALWLAALQGRLCAGIGYGEDQPGEDPQTGHAEPLQGHGRGSMAWAPCLRIGVYADRGAAGAALLYRSSAISDRRLQAAGKRMQGFENVGVWGIIAPKSAPRQAPLQRPSGQGE